jgi:mycothiol synthase
MVDADLPALHALVSEPALASEFRKLVPGGALAAWWRDPYLDRDLCQVATDGDAIAGFTLGFSVPALGGGTWAALRLGVRPESRRRGIGSALFAHARERIVARGAPAAELSLSAWQPNPAAAAFAAHLGFPHARWFWRMQRPLDLALQEARWPTGITLRLVDGSDASVAAWSEVHNRSFAEHYHFVPATPAVLRRWLELPEIRVTVGLAYRDAACVGFCACTVIGGVGEIADLGVVGEERKRGLGRALLRWGSAWLADQKPRALELMVDGQNEKALALYRSEGFTVDATRETWARSIP